MSNRFKLRTKKGKIRWEKEDSLEEWIYEKIPPCPENRKCEHDRHDWGEDPEGIASTYSYIIENGHVCYSYICDPCSDQYTDDNYLEPERYPTTKDGYAVVPRHCS